MELFSLSGFFFLPFFAKSTVSDQKFAIMNLQPTRCDSDLLRVLLFLTNFLFSFPPFCILGFDVEWARDY